MTLISSWGHPSANSYVSLSAAHSYAVSAVLDNSAWKAASPEQRESALVEATMDIDTGEYYGSRFYTDQALEFPRRGQDIYQYDDVVILETGLSAFQARMQKDVEIATIYQAIHRLQQITRDTEEHAANRQAGIQSIKDQVGPLTTEIRYGGAGSQATGGSFNEVMQPRARKILSIYRVGRRVWRG